MANCTKCGRDVGCSCNLFPPYDQINGVCPSCRENHQSQIIESGLNQITREQIAGKPNA